jgi:L-2-hydroxyglutarate oxidase LhgO
VESDTLDVIIIGGGVTGLAAATAIAERGHSVAVFERRPRPGMETSTHNSGVIHGGMYYPTGSLKAQLCVEGAARLFEFCTKHNVPHERCGKLIVAARRADADRLEKLCQLGTANGVQGLEIVDETFIKRREPHVAGVAALWSPNTGRLDAAMLVNALRRTAEAAGAMFVANAGAHQGEPTSEGFRISTTQETAAARVVVNAAGLHADDVSAMLGGETFKIYPVRGEYAQLRRSLSSWVNGLVYPLPDSSGHSLGVHLTKAPDGTVLLGPTARYQSDKEDYENDRLPLESFVEPARALLPAVTLEDLAYGGSGIRPKLAPPDVKFADFMIRRDARQPRLVQASGIESPGLTACLAVGARVAALVDETLT